MHFFQTLHPGRCIITAYWMGSIIFDLDKHFHFLAKYNNSIIQGVLSKFIRFMNFKMLTEDQLHVLLTAKTTAYNIISVFIDRYPLCNWLDCSMIWLGYLNHSASCNAQVLGKPTKIQTNLCHLYQF